jgi:hypothetical protein
LIHRPELVLELSPLILRQAFRELLMLAMQRADIRTHLLPSLSDGFNVDAPALARELQVSYPGTGPIGHLSADVNLIALLVGGANPLTILVALCPLLTLLGARLPALTGALTTGLLRAVLPVMTAASPLREKNRCLGQQDNRKRDENSTLHGEPPFCAGPL